MCRPVAGPRPWSLLVALGAFVLAMGCEPGPPAPADAASGSDVQASEGDAGDTPARDAAVGLLDAPTIDASTPASIEALLDALAPASCAAELRCMGRELTAPWLAPTCVQRQTDHLRWLLRSVSASAESGRARIDGSRLDACLDAIDAAPCDALLLLATGCRGLVVGLVSTGGACTLPSDCAEGHDCTGHGCETTCVRTLERGQACSATSAPCPRALECIGSPARCQPLPHEGEPCADGSRCANGFLCLPEAGAPRCRAVTTLLHGELGEPCGLGVARLCRVGLACTGDASGADPRCQLPIASGAECTYGSACAQPDEVCDAVFGATGVCAPLPVTGEPCTGLCAYPSVCDGSRCRELAELGDACVVDEDCSSRVCHSGSCAPPCP